MRLKVGFLFLCCVPLFLAACASSGASRQQEQELTIRPLSSSEMIHSCVVIDCPHPFVSYKTRITTMPTNLLAAEIHVPKSADGANIQEMSLYSASGDFIAEALTIDGLKKYWEQMGFLNDVLAKMNDLIDRYYLRSTTLDSRATGRNYFVIYLTKDPVKPTDRVTATIEFGGETKTFDIDVGTAAPTKKKTSKSQKDEPKAKIAPKAPTSDQAEPAANNEPEGTPIK